MPASSGTSVLFQAVSEFAERLFDGSLPWAKVRQNHKLIRLGERYTTKLLDAACRRALDVDLIDVRRVERILVQVAQEYIGNCAVSVSTTVAE